MVYTCVDRLIVCLETHCHQPQISVQSKHYYKFILCSYTAFVLLSVKSMLVTFIFNIRAVLIQAIFPR